MINSYKYILNFLTSNFFILKIKYKKIIEQEFDHDFSNLYFIDHLKNKKILLKNNEKFNKNDEDFFIYHSFNWLKVAKETGGSEIVKLTRDKILTWIKANHGLRFYLSNLSLLSKRAINLIYHYDFYGSTANIKDKSKIKFIIYCHYVFLKNYLENYKESSQELIEVKKTVLLYEAIHKLNTNKTVDQIKNSLNEDLNSLGLHQSMSPQIHAEYINHLIEIKRILLYFNIKIPKEIEFQIINMISVLKNFIHNDGSLAFFNGSNNYYLANILKIFEYEKDIKTKNLKENVNGLVAYENKNLKVIFDVVRPQNKSINYGLHASTLSLELSCGNEKIISNCGSLNKKNNKTPNYFRYSAAHSTIILNNTNISELIENKSYKRFPKRIEFEKKEDDHELIWIASHNGYYTNYKKIIKREILINKKNDSIKGRDQIISIGISKQKNIFSSRFHLTPICKAILTRGKMSAIIKTKNSSYIFNSDEEINLEESIFVNELNKIVKTSQIVMSGICNNPKKTINWSISRY